MALRIQRYENLLRGSAGLLAVTPAVTNADWAEYYEQYKVQVQFPAVKNVGVLNYVAREELAAYAERNPSVEVAASVRDNRPHTPVTLEAVFSGNGSAPAFDAYAEATRQRAIDKAVSTGKATMSGPVRESQQTDKRDSFIMYMPIYQKDAPVSTAAERIAAVESLAYATVDTSRFASDVLADNQNSHVALQLKDVETTDDTPAFQSSQFASIKSKEGARVETVRTELFGNAWDITFAASPDLMPGRDRQLPAQALWRGLITCIFFAGLVWYLITDRERKYARQKQEEVQTAKDDLLSLASHQLRTPATVVKQYVGMLLQGYAGKLSERQVDMLNNAYASNERQLEIINQLLYVARLDAGRITLHAKKVDITRLLREVVHDQNEAINARRQQLTLKIPSRPLLIEADPHYVRMVLENLLSNAVKYTPESGAITFEAHRAPGAGITIRVKDTGVGIDSAMQDTIFEKFTRVENELSSDVNGSGVGLYLTKQIVELHGGTITVKSQIGKGTVFTIHLPMTQPQTTHDPGNAPMGRAG